MAQVDLTGLHNKIKKLQTVKKEVMKPAYDYFKNITPIKSGNARSKTKLVNQDITADYGYAKILDEGKSKQAPDGMSDPTIELIQRLANDFINKNGSK